MGLRVDLSLRPKKDLRQISAFIARHNPTRSRTFRRELGLKAYSLGEHPQMGRVVPELSDASVREIIHGAYRIIYKITDDPERISILRFWHGARGHPQIVED